MVLQYYLFCDITVWTRLYVYAGNKQIKCPPFYSEFTAESLSLCLLEVQSY